MYSANNTFRASGNLWAGQFITVGTNIPVVNSTGHWVGRPLVANNSATANVSNVAVNARITNVTTGTYFPIVTDTTITGADTFHYSSNDFLMYAANNTFRATGNLWAGQFITVGSNVPVVNSTGHWVIEQNDKRLCIRGTEHLFSVYYKEPQGRDIVLECVAENTAKEDALLISAAPDMFQALQAIVDAFGDQNSLLVDQCKAALAKAKGEA